MWPFYQYCDDACEREEHGEVVWVKEVGEDVVVHWAMEAS